MGYADQVFDLTGKVVVVTGGSRGLGRQIATAVARQGADVVIASRKLPA
jgi:NAD(P)-dependent dehydrogenase (short-subunit alcohol dehydrogenase family)